MMIYSANVQIRVPIDFPLTDAELASMSIIERSTWLDLRHEAETYDAYRLQERTA